MATKRNYKTNGHEYYRLRKKIGEKNGKSVYKAFYGTSKSDAESQYKKWYEQQIRDEYDRKISADLNSFSERADEFIENALKPSQKYAQGSKTRYISSYNTHVKDSFLADMPASKVKAADIQKFYNDLDVSKATLRQVHKFMSAFYKWMVRNEYAYNVLDAVEIPIKEDTRRHKKIIVWTDDEIKAITENIADHRLRFMIYVMLYAGLRTGEAIALKYSDFDMKKDILYVQRQKYLNEVKEPKNGSSRDIPIHRILKEEFQRHKKWHKKEMKENHYKTDYVFTSSAGNLLDHKNISRSLKRFYSTLDIEPKHNHAYRSTFCTQLCKCGVPLEVASRILGHSNIEVTAKHYALIENDSKRDAIDLLEY